MKKPELLAPAGNLEKLKLACIYGADAVFLGGEQYGLRSKAGNFSIEEIAEGVAFAKEYGVDVYVTTNIYAHSENYAGFKEFVIALEQAGVVGIIVSDPGYIAITREYAKNLEIHISTQQSITNYETVKFYENLGVDRVVLARELSFAEIKEISDNTTTEIEVFIHGAVCSSYSGRCTLSNHMTSRDSNRGGCTQSCRWDYDLMYRENEQFYPVNKENDETAFTMSAKDMALLEYIPQLCQLNIDSFKIEGRMKSYHYLATIIKTYRVAIDSYFADPQNYQVKQEWIDELHKAAARETYEGALIGDFSAKGQIFNEQYRQNKEYDYCGYVLDYDQETKLAKIEQRNFFKVGDEIEFFGPNNALIKQKVDIIYNDAGDEIEKANHPLMIVHVRVEEPISKNWLIRKEK